MSLKDKMKTYNFWISLVSAIVLIVRILGDKFNFIVDTSLIMDITTGLCSIFVILGILSVPKSKQTSSTEEQPTTNETIQNIISNINSGRELINQMENNFFNNQNQYLSTQSNPEMPMPSPVETIVINNTTTDFNDEKQTGQNLDFQQNEDCYKHEEPQTIINDNLKIVETTFATDENSNEIQPVQERAHETERYDTNNLQENTYQDFKTSSSPIKEANNITTIESLSFMIEALKTNLNSVAKEFENYISSLK